VSLAHKHGRDLLPPLPLNRRQNANLVINDYVVSCPQASLDIVEFSFFVHIDERIAFDGFKQAAAFNFARLKYDVSVAEHSDFAMPVHPLQDLNCIWEEPAAEIVFDEEARQLQQMRIVRVVFAISLQSAKVIGVAEVHPQLFEDLPVPVRASPAHLAIQECGNILRDTIVIEQRIIHVEKKNDSSARRLCFALLDAEADNRSALDGQPFSS